MATSVIVVSHRPHQWLVPCLDSVSDQCDELIVVDNGSPDGQVGAAARRAGARLVKMHSNTGFPAGVNAGIRAASGDVVALLNDDAMADPGWLASAEVLLEDPGVGAVAPKLLFALPYAEVRFDDEPRRIGDDSRGLGRAIRSATVAGTDVLPALVGPGVHGLETGELNGREGPWRWTTGREPVFVPLWPHSDPADLRVDGEAVPIVRLVRLVNNAGSYLSKEGWAGDYGYLSPDEGRFDAPAERFGACGAAMVMRADTLDRVGHLASSFFAYYEDVDWCWRARLAGFCVRYEPSGVVRHVGGVTSGGPLAARVKGLAARNRLLCLARNAPMGLAMSELRKAMGGRPEVVPGLRRSLIGRLPGALATRPCLARRRQRTTAEVWERWSGVDEAW